MIFSGLIDDLIVRCPSTDCVDDKGELCRGGHSSLLILASYTHHTQENQNLHLPDDACSCATCQVKNTVIAENQPT